MQVALLFVTLVNITGSCSSLTSNRRTSAAASVRTVIYGNDNGLQQVLAMKAFYFADGFNIVLFHNALISYL